MNIFASNLSLLAFCVVTFVFTLGASALVGGSSARQKSAPQYQAAQVRQGAPAVVMYRSRGFTARAAAAEREDDRYQRRRSRGYRSSSRTGSRGNRSYRGGGLFGGK